ncbi:hypothetical protein C3L33_05277, partial [Rhododendron williamsianum]
MVLHIANFFSHSQCCIGFDLFWIRISLHSINVDKVVSVKCVLDMLSFSAAILLLFCAFGDEKMWFWWLNPLLKQGKEKVLEDKDIPKLRQVDRAETCYFVLKEKLSKERKRNTDSFSFDNNISLAVESYFSFWVFRVDQGLFLGKCFESLSVRQWSFRTRLIGLQIRSLLTAAIYQKQLKLSNAAKINHSPGHITNYVMVDSTDMDNRTSDLLAKLQHKYLAKLMVAQDRRLKAMAEALTNMKLVGIDDIIITVRDGAKFFTDEAVQVTPTAKSDTTAGQRFEGGASDFKNVSQKFAIERGFEYTLSKNDKVRVTILCKYRTVKKCMWHVHARIMPGNEYFHILGMDLAHTCGFAVRTLTNPHATAELVADLVSDDVRGKHQTRPVDVVKGIKRDYGLNISYHQAWWGIEKAKNRYAKKTRDAEGLNQVISISTTRISWDSSSLKPTLNDINLVVRCGEKIAVCGEVGSGKSTLIAAILGEVPDINGIVQVYGEIAYVSQTAWIQTGAIQENILFGCTMDQNRYQEVLEKCSPKKDLEMLPFGDCTIIGERGVNLSGGQKQWVQLAHALYKDADIYLLDDPFSAEYVMGALVSSDMSIVDLELVFIFTSSIGNTMNAYFSFGVLASLTWPILFVILPMVIRLYFASAKELMRLDSTTKSSVASHLAESVAGAVTIRAFGEED